MGLWELLFILSGLLFFYNYAGYAIIAMTINKLTKKNHTKDTDFCPTVSFIVAAYNEEDVIEKKIIDSLQQSYPADKIEFIFITDGSTDKTPEIINRYPQLILLHNQERKGKSAALNRAIASANNNILIMCDANTFLNKDAVKNIAIHYCDNSVGGVAGEKKVLQSADDSEGIGTREGLYWKYESFLKKVDSEFYSVVGAAGELFSVRKSLYEPVEQSVILDDFVISLKVAQKGYRIIYEPDAYAMEFSSLSIKDERKRKVRIAAGGFQAMQMLFPLLFFWKHWRLTFLYVSHRVLRWTLSPVCLILAFFSNFILIIYTQNELFIICFVLQIMFYSTAFFSKFISDKSRLKFLKSLGYFVFMNISVIQGFFRYIAGNQAATWEKVKRSTASINLK